MIIAAGGTAGHLVPALALADALTDEGAEVSFIGTPRGLERELVPPAGYQLDFADLRGLERKLSPRQALFFWSLLKGSADCLKILRWRRPQVVVGGGGYVSGIPVFLAALLGKPTLIVELDSHMGLANRALSRLAARVALSFPIPGRSGGKYLLSGRPLSRQLVEADAAAGRTAFGLKEGTAVVVVTGGSLGARSINLACVEAFGGGPLPFQLVHVSGKRDFALTEERLQKSGADRENYHLLDYTNSLPLALAAADLVVGRSGASVQEVAALGKPALLIPYPHATADHQQRNAEWMAAAGAAEIIRDEQLTGEKLKAAVMGLLADRERLAAMAAASARLGRPGGARTIAAEILRIGGQN